MKSFIPVLSSLGMLWGSSEQNWFVSLSKKLVLICILISIVLLFWRYGSLPPLVPIWFGKPWGVDRLAHPLWLVFLPTGSLLTLIINTILSRTLTRDMLIFTQILAATTLIVAILSLVTLTKILFLVS